MLMLYTLVCGCACIIYWCLIVHIASSPLRMSYSLLSADGHLYFQAIGKSCSCLLLLRMCCGRTPILHRVPMSTYLPGVLLLLLLWICWLNFLVFFQHKKRSVSYLYVVFCGVFWCFMVQNGVLCSKCVAECVSKIKV